MHMPYCYHYFRSGYDLLPLDGLGDIPLQPTHLQPTKLRLGSFHLGTCHLDMRTRILLA